MAETTGLGLFLVRYYCGGRFGVRSVWAPDEDTAGRQLLNRPSTFGLPHEHVEILTASRIDLRESTIV